MVSSLFYRNFMRVRLYGRRALVLAARKSYGVEPREGLAGVGRALAAELRGWIGHAAALERRSGSARRGGSAWGGPGVGDGDVRDGPRRPGGLPHHAS